MFRHQKHGVPAHDPRSSSPGEFTVAALTCYRGMLKSNLLPDRRGEFVELVSCLIILQISAMRVDMVVLFDPVVDGAHWGNLGSTDLPESSNAWRFLLLPLSFLKWLKHKVGDSPIAWPGSDGPMAITEYGIKVVSLKIPGPASHSSHGGHASSREPQ